ncbi:hypothetical protein PsorP6_017279 [Peronosclerospora sorghi]|uniref:Uncharacterized protein n=1 Tax=Peronosclerospora sorghi TaxID=230839 RepID=A0ACC0WNH7_9STRA|nr:hypothetical protein PsorP6_017279 [Peronosclerospora sorghi]
MDGVLRFARDARNFVEHLRVFFEIHRHLRLAFNAEKCNLFASRVTGWLTSIVDYARAVAPLKAKPESVMDPLGRKKKQLCGVDLSWEEDKNAFYTLLKLL